MTRKKLINELTKEYIKALNPKSLPEFYEKVSSFVVANEHLSDNEFLEKFNMNFPFIKLCNEFANKQTLYKIAQNTTTLKTIVLIYFIVSIIAGLILAFQL